MDFLGLLEKIGVMFGLRPKLDEEDVTIKAIYVILQKAEEDLRTYNAISRGKNPSPEKVYSKEEFYDLHSALKKDKLKNKVFVLKQLKKDINNILREF